MGVINVKTTSLTEIGGKLKRLTNNVDAIGKGFSSVRSSLDSDVKGKSGIGNDMKNSSDDLNNIEKVLRNASRYIDEVVKSYSGDEKRLAQFVAKMNLKAVSERSCSSVTEIMLEAMYYGAKGWEAVQAIVQSGFFGDAGTISSDLSYSRELLFAKSNTSGTAKIDKVNSVPAKAYIKQEKELSWDEVLEYASKSPEVGEWAKTVEERIKNSYVPYEAQKGMIEALRPKAMEMWNVLEKELTWEEVLEYASKSPEVGEWAKTVEERIKNSYVPYEAQKGMIEALRPKAMEMWSLLENANGEGTSKGDGAVSAIACTTSGTHAGGLTQAQMEANAQYIYDYFTKLGWSKEAICGMLGNMQWESGSINPGAWQFWNKTGAGCGYGLVQWTPAGNKFLKWAGLDAEGANNLAQNDPKQLMDKQLDFLLINLNLAGSKEEKSAYGGEWIPTTKYSSPYKMTVSEFIKSDKNAGELALVFHGSFERSGDAPGSTALKKRVEYANKWYDFFSK